jgi:hypothetical protein
VSQISPPIRIVLAVAVVFLAAWMTVLKPKTADVAPGTGTPPAGNVATGEPAVSAPGQVAEAAKGAAAATNAQTDAVDAATGGSAATGTAAGTQAGSTSTSAPTAAATAKAVEASGIPTPIARAIAKDKVVALLFWNDKSADDRAVRTAFAKADRWNGRVVLAKAPVGRVSRYSSITRGVDVEQSPTIVVIDRNLNATPLVGYVDTRSIDQAVVDALRNSGGLFTAAYLREVNDACAGTSRSLFAIPDAQSPAQARTVARRQAARWQAFTADLRGIPAPARFRAFKRATVADAAAIGSVLATWSAAVSSAGGTAGIVRATATADSRLTPVMTRFTARMDGRHVLSCGSNA